jgi:hypothetical protein
MAPLPFKHKEAIGGELVSICEAAGCVKLNNKPGAALSVKGKTKVRSIKIRFNKVIEVSIKKFLLYTIIRNLRNI